MGRAAALAGADPVERVLVLVDREHRDQVLGDRVRDRGEEGGTRDEEGRMTARGPGRGVGGS